VVNNPDRFTPYVPTLAEQLTARFYAWERRGRGWQVWGEPVDLEPAYEPFFHCLPDLRAAVDDGHKPTVFSLLAEKTRSFFAGSNKKSESYQAEVVAGESNLRPAAFVDRSEIREVGVSLFADQKVTVESAEQFVLGLGGCAFPLSFEIVARADGISTQVACRSRDASLVIQQLRACFPEAATEEEPEALGTCWDHKKPTGIVEFGLSSEFMRPLKTFRRLDPDPLAGIIGAMEGVEKDELGLLQVLFQRAQHPWAEDVLRSVTDREGRSFFADSPDMISLARDKIGRPLFAAVLRVAAQSHSKSRARQIVKALAAGLKQLDNPPSNELIPLDNQGYDDTAHVQDVLRRQSCRNGMLLNSQELLAVAHLPSESVRSEKLARQLHKTKAAPADAQGQQMILGENIHQGKKRTVALGIEQRVRHAYIVGASGTGKSTLLLNMVLQDISAGHGVGLLDPHGDLVNAVLRRIPEGRIDDVVLFDASDTEYPFALNILEAHDESERERIVAETIMALERYFPASWGPRLERILQYTLRTVLHAVPGATLADVELMLTDPDYREGVLGKTTDPRMLQFWTNQFKFFPKNATDPVLNKISVFLLDRHVRNITCQRRAAVNFDKLLNDGKILLANLSTGLLTEKVAGTLGSFLVTKIVNAAFRRAALPESKRRPWFLYVDEFQSFMNLSVGFERILAEARKYRLVLAGLANQYVGQLSPAVRQAIFGNVGSLVVFRLGVEDAHATAKELGVFTADDILNLDVGQAIIRIGTSQTAFNLHTFREPPASAMDPTSRVVAVARKHYARPRREVEAELAEVAKAAERLETIADAAAGEEPPSDPSEDDLVR
jgi:hypothetical protein